MFVFVFNQHYNCGYINEFEFVCFVEGCYPDNIDLLQDVVKKNMTLSSIGMCQEMCFHEKSYKFAVKVYTLHRIQLQ